MTRADSQQGRAEYGVRAALGSDGPRVEYACKDKSLAIYAATMASLAV